MASFCESYLNVPKLIVCPENCKYSAKTNYDMKRHLIGTHGLKEEEALAKMPDVNLNIKCHLCPHKFSSRKRLIEHLNSAHFFGIQIQEAVLDSEEGKLTNTL